MIFHAIYPIIIRTHAIAQLIAHLNSGGSFVVVVCADLSKSRLPRPFFAACRQLLPDSLSPIVFVYLVYFNKCVLYMRQRISKRARIHADESRNRFAIPCNQRKTVVAQIQNPSSKQ